MFDVLSNLTWHFAANWILKALGASVSFPGSIPNNHPGPVLCLVKAQILMPVTDDRDIIICLYEQEYKVHSMTYEVVLGLEMDLCANEVRARKQPYK